MSWLLMEKLLRHQQSVRSSEGCCVDRLNSPPNADNFAARAVIAIENTRRFPAPQGIK